MRRGSRHHRRAVALLVGWLCLVGMSGRIALAESPVPPEASRAEPAKLRYEQGVRAAAQGRWEEARIAFAGAWAVKQHPQIAINLGIAEMNVRRHRDAAEHLSYFLREASSISETDRKRSTDLLDQARKHIGVLHVSVSPAGAELLIDGRLVGRPSPVEVFVGPGKVHLEARKEGYVHGVETRVIAAGTEQQVKLQLVEAPWYRTRALPIAGGALAGALAVTAIGLATQANPHPAPHDHRPTLFGNMAFWFGTSAAVVAGATGLLSWQLGREARPVQVEASLFASPLGGGAVFSGSF